MVIQTQSFSTQTKFSILENSSVLNRQKVSPNYYLEGKKKDEKLKYVPNLS